MTTRRLANHRDSRGRVAFLNEACWRKGCGSLGKLRYSALLDVNDQALAGDDVCLIDIKEAVRALALVPRSISVPKGRAARAVMGAKLSS